MFTWLGRAGVALLTTAATVGVVAAPAQAASTGIVYLAPPIEPGDPIGVIFKAGAGRKNNVVISRSGRTITIDDRVTLRAGKGCKKVKKDKTKVRCTTSKEIGHVSVTLGAGHDKVTNRTSIALVARGGSGNDTLIGGAGGDFLQGDTGTDHLWGLGGVDSLYGGDGNDALSGGAGHDRLSGDRGNDREYGGDGNDTHSQGKDTAFADADLLSGGAGTDMVTYVDRVKPVVADSDGAKGDDGRKGEGDTILGAEYLIGGQGDDRLVGTNGRDRLSGLGGNDVLIGNGGDDLLEDYTGKNRLEGGAGNDVLESGTGDDLILGGPGEDTVDYEWRFVPVTVDLDGVADDGQAGEKDTLTDVENVRGGQADDVLTGNDGPNRFDGQNGNDVIRAGGGDDVLIGHLGTDQLFGEAGDDYLDGARTEFDKADDLLDGGDNGTPGDNCVPNGADKVVNCEYSRPATGPIFPPTTPTFPV